MCRGGKDNCAHRRCTLNTHQKQEANRRRVQNRAIHNARVEGSKAIYGEATASALKKIPPRATYAFYLAMNSVDPRRASKFAGLVPKFPGRQNMIIEDTRDHSSDFGVKQMGNNEKYEPGAIYAIQRAVLEADRDAASRLPADQREARLAALKIREDALNLGLLDGKPYNKSREFNDDQKKFLSLLTGDDLSVLGEVPQRVYDDVFMRHLKEADFTTELRSTQGCVALSGTDKGPHYTLEELYKDNHAGHDKGVPLAEGLVLRRATDGGFELYDTDLNIAHPAHGYQRGIDAVALCPKFTDVSLPRNARGREVPTSVGQFSTERSLLDKDSAKGISHRKQLLAAASTAAYASGVAVNAPGDGRDERRQHVYLAKAGLGVLPDEDYHTRTEGFLLKGIAEAAMRTKREQVARLADDLGVQITKADRTANGNPRTSVGQRYNGDLDTDALKAVRHSGFSPRVERSTRVPEVDAALKVPVEAFDNASTSPRDGIDMEFGGKAAKLVNEANRLARNGAHPERVPVDAHVSMLELEDAFHARALNPDDSPVVVSAVSTVPRGWDSETDGDFFDKVLSKGTRLDTVGYVRGAANGTDAAKVRESAARDNQYVVKYLTTSSLRDSDDAVVVGDKTRFIVHSVDRSGSVPVVYMVQDDYAADLAAA